jgi:hypothetical protein
LIAALAEGGRLDIVTGTGRLNPSRERFIKSDESSAAHPPHPEQLPEATTPATTSWSALVID